MTLYLIAVFVTSGFASIFIFHSGVKFLCTVLGRDACVEESGLNGCNWWPYSQLLSCAIALPCWKPFGWAGMAAVLVGPLVITIVAALMLRFGERSSRKRQFSIDNEHIRDLRSGDVLQPIYFQGGGDYYQTGPGSGYCLYSIMLYDARQQLVQNSYVNDSAYRKDRQRLVDVLGCHNINVAFVVDAGEQGIASVVFGQEWNDFLYSETVSAPANITKWWAQFSSPSLSSQQVIDLNAARVQEQLDAVAALLRERGLERYIAARDSVLTALPTDRPWARVGEDIANLMNLCKLQGTIFAMRHDHVEQFRKERWGGEFCTTNTMSNGIWFSKPGAT
jgi:hypothetical protein